MIYLLLAILSSASMTLGLKFFEDDNANRYGIILGNYLTCVCISLILMPDRGRLFSMESTTLLCGVIGGFLFVAGLTTIQKSIPANGASLTAAFARLGLIVSLAASIFLFGERPGALQIAGMVLVIAAVFLINADTSGVTGAENVQKEKGTGALSLLLITMLAGGLADTMAKVFETVGSREEDTAYFFVLFVTASVITAFLGFREYKKTGKKIAARKLLAGVAVGIPNYFSASLFLQALIYLPAVVAYPVFSTGSIILVMLCSALFFKERLGSRQLAGIGIILAALVLLNV